MRLSWLLLLVCGAFWGCDRVALQVWRSEARLWAQAQRVAPWSVRALVNLDKARARGVP